MGKGKIIINQCILPQGSINKFGRIFISFLLILLGIVAVIWFSRERILLPQPYSETRILMDTAITITAYGPGKEQAVKAAFSEFKRVESICNRFDPDSQVSKINKMAGIGKVEVDPDLVGIIRNSIELSGKLDGAFDISIGALTNLWGIGHKGKFIPTRDQIDQVLPLVDYRLIEVDGAHNSVYLPKKGMMIDLGGVAKGVAINKAAEVLRNFGIKSALIDDGGDIRVIGSRPDGSPWRIGVQDPRKEEGIVMAIRMVEYDTLSTSGDYRRFFEKSGIRYHHIIDPKTGKQPKGVRSVTLVYKDSKAITDVPSVGIFVLGVEKGLAALKQFPGVEVIFITSDGRIIVSSGLEGKMKIIK